jgi:hypothetical protein
MSLMEQPKRLMIIFIDVSPWSPDGKGLHLLAVQNPQIYIMDCDGGSLRS